MMIDKLEVRVPRSAEFAGDFDRLYRSVRGTGTDPFRSSQHYTAVGDVRPFGFSAVVHVICKHGDGNHKLELIDTGRMTYSDMRREIERVFKVDAAGTGVMRIDLAADLPGIPVSAFVQRARARWKRWTADIGHFAEMGTGQIETHYLGKRPNCFRIYNKVAELQHQYAALRRGAEDKTLIPPFEEIFGYPPDLTLTRVERQYGGGRVPAEIDTVAKLTGLSKFNPFEDLEFTSEITDAPGPENFDLETYLAGMKLRELQAEWGMQWLRKFVNKHSRRNASKVLRKYEPFLGSKDLNMASVLVEKFHESVGLQLAA